MCVRVTFYAASADTVALHINKRRSIINEIFYKLRGESAMSSVAFDTCGKCTLKVKFVKILSICYDKTAAAQSGEREVWVASKAGSILLQGIVSLKPGLPIKIDVSIFNGNSAAVMYPMAVKTFGQSFGYRMASDKVYFAPDVVVTFETNPVAFFGR